MEYKRSIDVINLNPIPLATISFSEDIVTQEDIEMFGKIELLKHFETDVMLSASGNILEQIEFDHIKNKFDEAVDYYLKKLLSVTNNFKMINSWLTMNKRGSRHPKHKHFNTIVSAVTYFNEDCSKDPVSGIFFEGEGLDSIFRDFRFDYNVDEGNIYNARGWTVFPKVNDIIVFPGWVNHASIQNNFQKNRYCIGVNYFLNDTLGVEHHYNKIKIDV